MTDRECEPSRAFPVLLSLITLYFGFAAAIAVDELLLRTFVIASNMPDWMEEVIRTLYWPVIKTVRLFF